MLIKNEEENKMSSEEKIEELKQKVQELEKEGDEYWNLFEELITYGYVDIKFRGKSYIIIAREI